jgi:hypothetical protein
MNLTESQRNQLANKYGLDDVYIDQLENYNFTFAKLKKIMDELLKTANNHDDFIDQLLDRLDKEEHIAKKRKHGGSRTNKRRRRKTIRNTKINTKKRFKKRYFKGGNGFTTTITTEPIAYKEDEYDQFKNMLNYKP